MMETKTKSSMMETKVKKEYSLIVPRVINNFDRIFKKLAKNKFVVATNGDVAPKPEEIYFIAYLNGESLSWIAEVNGKQVLDEEKAIKHFKALNLTIVNLFPEPVLPFNIIEPFIFAKFTGIIREKKEKNPDLQLDFDKVKLYFSYRGEDDLPIAELRYEKEGILVIEPINPDSLIS